MSSLNEEFIELILDTSRAAVDAVNWAAGLESVIRQVTHVSPQLPGRSEAEHEEYVRAREASPSNENFLIIFEYANETWNSYAACLEQSKRHGVVDQLRHATSEVACVGENCYGHSFFECALAFSHNRARFLVEPELRPYPIDALTIESIGFADLRENSEAPFTRDSLRTALSEGLAPEFAAECREINEPEIDVIANFATVAIAKEAQRATGKLPAFASYLATSPTTSAHRIKLQGTGIPSEFRSKVLTKRKAAQLLGRANEDSGVKWLTDCISDGSIRCERHSRQAYVFDMRDFPSDAHDAMRSKSS